MKKISYILFLIMLSSPARADMSESLCQAYMPVVDQALMLREQGVPIDMARESAESALETSGELWRFLIKAINTAYKDPNRIRKMLRDGSLIKICVGEVRGY